MLKGSPCIVLHALLPCVSINIQNFEKKMAKTTFLMIRMLVKNIVDISSVRPSWNLYTVRKPKIHIFKNAKKNQSKIIFQCWDISFLVEQIQKKWRKNAITFGAIMVRALLYINMFPLPGQGRQDQIFFLANYYHY